MTERHENWPSTATELQAMLVAERDGRPFLFWRDADKQLKFLLLDSDRPRLTVGRRDSADVPLPWDDQVSRLHATFELVGEDWTVVDQNSTNGTWLNGGFRVASSKRLGNKDHLFFGGTRVDYHCSTHESTTTSRAPGSPSTIPLNERKRKVLIALCRPVFVEGATTPATNPQIAEALNLALDTVKGILKELFEQFGLGSVPQNEKRARLVAIVRDYKLLAPHDF